MLVAVQLLAYDSHIIIPLHSGQYIFFISCMSPSEAGGMDTGKNIDHKKYATRIKQAEEIPTTENTYLYTYEVRYYHLLEEVGRDLFEGVSKISNTSSVTAPLNSILVWLSLADGEQLRTMWNLGGYMPPFSLTSSLRFVSSQKSLTKKSTSLIFICRNMFTFTRKCNNIHVAIKQPSFCLSSQPTTQQVVIEGDISPVFDHCRSEIHPAVFPCTPIPQSDFPLFQGMLAAKVL